MRSTWTILGLRGVSVSDTHAGLRRFSRPHGGRDATRSGAKNDRPPDARKQADWHDRYDDGVALDQELNERHVDAEGVDDAESDRAEDRLASPARLEGARAASRRNVAESGVDRRQESGPVDRSATRVAEPRDPVLEAQDQHDGRQAPQSRSVDSGSEAERPRDDRNASRGDRGR